MAVSDELSVTACMLKRADSAAPEVRLCSDMSDERAAPLPPPPAADCVLNHVAVLGRSALGTDAVTGGCMGGILIRARGGAVFLRPSPRPRPRPSATTVTAMNAM